MVGSAGNAPVRRFRLCFATPDLQSGSRITSRGSGSGSYTHLKKFMRLLSVPWSSFPQLELVESAGRARINLLARQVHYLSATTPKMKNENGKLPPCCPE